MLKVQVEHQVHKVREVRQVILELKALVVQLARLEPKVLQVT